MSVDTSFESFETDLENQAPPEPQPEAASPTFSIDDLAPIEESDLPASDPEKEELKRRVAEFERRPAPSPFDQPKPQEPQDPRVALKAKFIEKLQSGDPESIADAFVMAAELGAQGAEERLRGQISEAKGAMIERNVERFVAEQRSANPQLWKAIQKDFDTFMADAKKRVDANPAAKAQLTDAMVREACTEFFERSKGKALDRYLAKAEKAKQAPTPTPSVPREAVPDYNVLSGPPGGNKGPLVGRDSREERIIKDGRIAGLSDDDIRDLL